MSFGKAGGTGRTLGLAGGYWRAHMCRVDNGVDVICDKIELGVVRGPDSGTIQVRIKGVREIVLLSVGV